MTVPLSATIISTRLSETCVENVFATTLLIKTTIRISNCKYSFWYHLLISQVGRSICFSYSKIIFYFIKYKRDLIF